MVTANIPAPPHHLQATNISPFSNLTNVPTSTIPKSTNLDHLPQTITTPQTNAISNTDNITNSPDSSNPSLTNNRSENTPLISPDTLNAIPRSLAEPSAISNTESQKSSSPTTPLIPKEVDNDLVLNNLDLVTSFEHIISDFITNIKTLENSNIKELLKDPQFADLNEEISKLAQSEDLQSSIINTHINNKVSIAHNINNLHKEKLSRQITKALTKETILKKENKQAINQDLLVQYKQAHKYWTGQVSDQEIQEYNKKISANKNLMLGDRKHITEDEKYGKTLTKLKNTKYGNVIATPLKFLKHDLLFDEILSDPNRKNMMGRFGIENGGLKHKWDAFKKIYSIVRMATMAIDLIGISQPSSNSSLDESVADSITDFLGLHIDLPIPIPISLIMMGAMKVADKIIKKIETDKKITEYINSIKDKLILTPEEIKEILEQFYEKPDIESLNDLINKKLEEKIEAQEELLKRWENINKNCDNLQAMDVQIDKFNKLKESPNLSIEDKKALDKMLDLLNKQKESVINEDKRQKKQAERPNIEYDISNKKHNEHRYNQKLVNKDQNIVDERQHQSIQSQFEALEMQDGLHQQASIIKQKIKKFNRRSERLNQEQETLKKREMNLQTELQIGEITQKEFDQATQEYENANYLIKEIKEEINEINKDLESKQKEISKTQKKLDQQQKTIDATQQELDQKQKTLDIQQSNLDQQLNKLNIQPTIETIPTNIQPSQNVEPNTTEQNILKDLNLEIEETEQNIAPKAPSNQADTPALTESQLDQTIQNEDSKLNDQNILKDIKIEETEQINPSDDLSFKNKLDQQQKQTEPGAQER